MGPPRSDGDARVIVVSQLLAVWHEPKQHSDRGAGPAPESFRSSCGIADNLVVMADTLRFTIHYSDGGEGWIMAQVEEVPGAISQGRTREEARENVVDALRLMLRPEPGESSSPDRDTLELQLAS